jgi:hypothetical protein
VRELSVSHWPLDRSQSVEDTTVGGVLWAAAAVARDRVAIIEGCVDPAERRQWTYGDLLDDAQRAARALCERDISRRPHPPSPATQRMQMLSDSSAVRSQSPMHHRYRWTPLAHASASRIS